jgi:hypothetical protein
VRSVADRVDEAVRRETPQKYYLGTRGFSVQVRARLRQHGRSCSRSLHQLGAGAQ